MFFRSDALHALTPRGVQQLAESPVTDVVDFRTAVERDTARDRLPHDRRIREHHLPLLEGAMSHLVEEALAALVRGRPHDGGSRRRGRMQRLPTPGEMDVGMLQHGATSFAEVVRLVVAPGAGVLVHCTAGKDRTGVSTALVLDALRARLTA